MDIKAFVKNYDKKGKVIQILNICVEENGKKIYKTYYLNYSKNKNTCYLSEPKEK